MNKYFLLLLFGLLSFGLLLKPSEAKADVLFSTAGREDHGEQGSYFDEDAFVGFYITPTSTSMYFTDIDVKLAKTGTLTSGTIHAEILLASSTISDLYSFTGSGYATSTNSYSYTSLSTVPTYNTFNFTFDDVVLLPNQLYRVVFMMTGSSDHERFYINVDDPLDGDGDYSNIGVISGIGSTINNSATADPYLVVNGSLDTTVRITFPFDGTTIPPGNWNVRGSCNYDSLLDPLFPRIHVVSWDNPYYLCPTSLPDVALNAFCQSDNTWSLSNNNDYLGLYVNSTSTRIIAYDDTTGNPGFNTTPGNNCSLLLLSDYADVINITIDENAYSENTPTSCFPPSISNLLNGEAWANFIVCKSNEFIDVIKYKFPFGYYFQIKEAYQSSATTTTALIDINFASSTAFDVLDGKLDGVRMTFPTIDEASTGMRNFMPEGMEDSINKVIDWIFYLLILMGGLLFLDRFISKDDNFS